MSNVEYGTIRFFGHTLHHNPHTLKISDSGYVKENIIPYKNSVLVNTGAKGMIIKGDGVFYGENPLQQYLQLREIYKKSKIGVLSIGGIGSMYAYLSDLQMKCEAVDNCIDYSFQFIKCDDLIEENSTAPSEYILNDGEDLWDVSLKLNIDIDKLMGLNLNIVSPVDISKGTIIKIR